MEGAKRPWGKGGTDPLKIKLICADCLTLTLDREELARSGLTSGELSPRDRRTRRLLAKLLVLARLETGAAFLGKKLCLQVFAQPEGGALFLFTAADRPAGSGETPAYVFGFADLSLLTESCAKLEKQFGPKAGRSALYLCEGVYYLALFGPREAAPVLFLREYTSLFYEGAVFFSFLAEHGRALIPEGAVAALAKL